jgi:hypothetical protein
VDVALHTLHSDRGTRQLLCGIVAIAVAAQATLSVDAVARALRCQPCDVDAALEQPWRDDSVDATAANVATLVTSAVVLSSLSISGGHLVVSHRSLLDAAAVWGNGSLFTKGHALLATSGRADLRDVLCQSVTVSAAPAVVADVHRPAATTTDAAAARDYALLYTVLHVRLAGDWSTYAELVTSPHFVAELVGAGLGA